MLGASSSNMFLRLERSSRNNCACGTEQEIVESVELSSIRADGVQMQCACFVYPELFVLSRMRFNKIQRYLRYDMAATTILRLTRVSNIKCQALSNTPRRELG